MKIHKDRIYIQQWLDFKPYSNQVNTDFYYLKICNSVRKSLSMAEVDFILNAEGINNLACFLTSYFEDIISKSNLWFSFVKMHKSLYGKPLPFYDLSEYYEGEINVQDVSFLIWYFLNTYQEQDFYGPTSELVLNLAINVMDVFEAEWDSAPENIHLNEVYSVSSDGADYYDARSLMDELLFNSYLFHFDARIKMVDSESILVQEFEGQDEEQRNQEMFFTYLRENRDGLVHNYHTRLLALKGKEWAAELVGKEHPFHNSFLTMSKRISGYFFYKGQDEKNIFLEHVASAKSFYLTKKSFEHSDSLKEVDSIIFIGIVKWLDEWWFSGTQFSVGFNADIVLDEKNSAVSRKAVSFLDHKKSNEVIKKQYNAFLEFNNNKAIAFLDGNKIDDFTRAYVDYFNNSLNLSSRKKENAINRAKKEGYFGYSESSTMELGADIESGLVYFNPDGGIEIALNMNSAFPDPNNPFFDKDACKDDLMGLLVSENTSAALAKYCIENYQADLPFFKTTEGIAILENIDFLLRFWKRESYYTEPNISFTG